MHNRKRSILALWYPALCLVAGCSTTVRANGSDGVDAAPSDTTLVDAVPADVTTDVMTADVVTTDGVTTDRADADDPGPRAALAAPRPLRPLSTSTVTSRRPTLRWALAGGTTGTRVEICRDRACARVEQAFNVEGASGRPGVELGTGVHFWRLYGRSSGATGATAGPTWEFFVRPRAAVDVSRGHAPDFDGDGTIDLIASPVPTPARRSRVAVYMGSPSGLTTPASRMVLAGDGPERLSSTPTACGDLNGDGFGDMMVVVRHSRSTSDRLLVFLSGPTGFGRTPHRELRLSRMEVVAPGDVDGDGYADLVLMESQTDFVTVYAGGASGLQSEVREVVLPLLEGQRFGASQFFPPRLAAVGDVDADGFDDLLVTVNMMDSFPSGSVVYLLPGGSGGPAPERARPLVPSISFSVAFGGLAAGDLNGDGFPDVLVTRDFNTWGGPPRPDEWRGDRVFLGGAGGLTLAEGDAWWQRSIAVARPAGDIDGDGRDDLLGIRVRPTVPTVRYECGVLLGSASGFGPASLRETQLPDGFELWDCAAGHDLDADGRDDLVVWGGDVSPSAFSPMVPPVMRDEPHLQGYIYRGGAVFPASPDRIIELD